jgi:hypothetical protein
MAMQSETGPGGRLERALEAAMAAFAGLLLAAVWIGPAPPLQDLMEWAWQGAVAAELRAGAAFEDVAFKTWPSPNSMLQALLWLGAEAGAPVLAARIAASAALAGGVGLALAAKRRGGAGAGMAVLSVAGGSVFLNGYLAFLTGALALAAAALALQRGWRPRALAVAAAAVAAFFIHGMALAGLSVLTAAHVLFGALRARHLAALLPGYALLGWSVAAGWLGETLPDAGAARLDPAGLARLAAYKVYTLAKSGPYGNLLFDGVSDALRFAPGYWAGVALNLVWAALAALAAAAALRRGLAAPARRASAAAALALLALFVATPGLDAPVVNPGERFLAMALLLIFALLGDLAPPRLMAALGAVSVAGVATALMLALGAASMDVARTAPQAVQPRDAQHLFGHRPGHFIHRLGQLEAGGPRPSDGIEFRSGLLMREGPPR